MAHVFHRPDVVRLEAAAPPGDLKSPANLRGRTQHFAVYVDPALGAGGQQVGDAVLARCEADYTTISGYFGGLSAGPFSVILFANPSGAYHMACDATDLYCDAHANPPDGAHSEFLNVAEFVEVFEAVQARGWNCGEGNGEALSRVLATDLYPASLNGFATAHLWLDSARPNYVDQNYPTDTNPVANGCGVLFLNWLRFQLGYSWQQIVAAAGPTLGQTYTALIGHPAAAVPAHRSRHHPGHGQPPTRKQDGFTEFKKLLDAHFPPGQPSGVATDNPFPL